MWQRCERIKAIQSNADSLISLYTRVNIYTCLQQQVPLIVFHNLIRDDFNRLLDHVQTSCIYCKNLCYIFKMENGLRNRWAWLWTIIAYSLQENIIVRVERVRATNCPWMISSKSFGTTWYKLARSMTDLKCAVCRATVELTMTW